MNDAYLSDAIRDSSRFYFCVLDPTGKIVTINARFAKLMGSVSEDALIGAKASDSVSGSVELKSFFESLSGDARPKNERIVQPVHRNGEKPLWIQFDLSPVIAGNRGTCLFVTGTDVTELVLARNEAERSAHERDGLIVRMGHELRTPINTVLGYAKLLRGLDGLVPAAAQYCDTIISNETTLLRLISDLLEYSKYQAGQTVTLLTETNIKNLVNEVSKSYIDQFSAKLLSLTVESKTDIPEAVMADSQKIAQVLSNLIDNSLKFTKKGGVAITLSYDGKMTIDVEDTGIGIGPAEAPHIFDVLGRIGTENEQQTGIGIGLALTRIFAQMMGGDVVLVRSTPGIGTLIRFTFDAKPVATHKKTSVSISDYTEIAGTSRPCKVLLVDDVDINLAMLEIFLSPAGFNVAVASNGNEAVKSFKSSKPDIVFMDLIMPEKDGFEATRELKEIDPNVPIIALTASIVDSVKEQALEAGVNDFMTKPFIPERFFEIIAEYTGITYLTRV